MYTSSSTAGPSMPKYRNLQTIGEGPAGKTYLGVKNGQNEVFAVKEITLQGISPEQLLTFELYLSAAKDIVHDNIVRYYGLQGSPAEKYVYLEAEYCVQGSVQDMIIAHKMQNIPIFEITIWCVAAFTTAALTRLQDGHLVQSSSYSYRCLRPSSILFTNQGTVKVDDFSITRLPNRNSLANTVILRPYMAPEIVANSSYGPATDVWSLGCILLAMCTLSDPSDDLLKARSPGAALDFTQFNIKGTYSPALLDLINSCLAISPRDRISVAQLAINPQIAEITSKSSLVQRSLPSNEVLLPSNISMQSFSGDTAMTYGSSLPVSQQQNNSHKSLQMMSQMPYSTQQMTQMAQFQPIGHLSQLPQVSQMKPPGLGTPQDMIGVDSMQSPASQPSPYSMSSPPGIGNMSAANGIASNSLINNMNGSNEFSMQHLYHIQQHLLNMGYMPPGQPQQQSQQQMPLLLPIQQTMPPVAASLTSGEETKLMVAVRTRDMPGIYDNIRQLKMKKADQTTALMIAAEVGNVEAVSYLLGEYRCRRTDGKTALMIAILCNNGDVARILADFEAKRRDEMGRTALMYACEKSMNDMVTILAETEATMTDISGYTALMIALQNGNVDGVKILLGKEARIALPDGTTALLIAQQLGNDALTKLIEDYLRAWSRVKGSRNSSNTNNVNNNVDDIDRSSSPSNKVTKNSRYPRNSKGAKNYKSVQGAKSTKSAKSTYISDTSDDNEELSEPRSHNRSPVHMHHSNIEDDHDNESHIKLTVYDPPIELSRGAGWSKNNENTTNLMEAARLGLVQSVKQHLHEKGQRDSKGWTALMKAAFFGKADCIPLLKSEMKMVNNAKFTALMSAASNGYPDCVKKLVSEAKLRNWKGETALMLAIYHEQRECVKILLEHEGAMRTLSDNLNMLEYAKKINKIRALDILEEYYRGIN